jgi:hypothetical protein
MPDLVEQDKEATRGHADPDIPAIHDALVYFLSIHMREKCSDNGGQEWLNS